MARVAVIDNVSHHDLRVMTAPHARFGDAVSSVTVIPREFSRLIAAYPIFLRKTGAAFEFAAQLGLAQGENLFLDDAGWRCDYIPLHVRRQPFQLAPGDGGHVLAIDLDSPRLSRSEGQRLFRDHGGLSDFLQDIHGLMNELVDGVHDTRDQVAALMRHDLIRPVELSVAFDGGQATVQGLYTIDADALRALTGDAVAELHAIGALETAHLQLASMAHIPALIAEKNRRLAQVRAA